MNQPAGPPGPVHGAIREHHTGDLRVAGLIVLTLFLVYNSNGREIGSVDSQPNKYAARELLLRHTLALNHVIGATPELAQRHSFVLGIDGRYRSAYSPLPAILAAVISWPLVKTGVLDLTAPLAAGVIAVVGASLLTAIAVALAYRTARRRASQTASLLLVAGLGLGTGLWSQVSRTLWVHETAILGLMFALAAFETPTNITVRRGIVLAVGLSIAGLARPQVAPIIGVLLAGVFWRGSGRTALIATALVLAAACALLMVNMQWFGHPLGPIAMMESANSRIHATRRSFGLNPEAFAGLLISPNRGLLIFSPVVLVALAGIPTAIREGWHSSLRWCALAAAAQYVLYGTYAVWWGGHTYGPRYLLDVLPVLVPLGAAGLAPISRSALAKGLVIAALVWSVVVQATGAFCYPFDQWNAMPDEIDRFHGRLWSWSDMQIVRCWHAGPSPANFNLFRHDAFRRPVP